MSKSLEKENEMVAQFKEAFFRVIVERCIQGISND